MYKILSFHISPLPFNPSLNRQKQGRIVILSFSLFFDDDEEQVFYIYYNGLLQAFVTFKYRSLSSSRKMHFNCFYCFFFFPSTNWTTFDRLNCFNFIELVSSSSLFPFMYCSRVWVKVTQACLFECDLVRVPKRSSQSFLTFNWAHVFIPLNWI